MKSVCLILSLVLAAAAQQQPQQPTKPNFMKAGTVEHNADNTATVTANYPSPLLQAIGAVRIEYGWQVNYEEPPYFSQYDLVDATDAKWRASHPLAKGVTRAAGGQFTSRFPEAANASEEELLKKIVSDYNASGNPGKFELRKEGAQSYSVVGVAVKDEKGNDRTLVPLLDTRLTEPSQELSANDALNLLLSLLGSQTGKTVIVGTYPVSTFLQAHGVAGGDNVPARILLGQVCALTGRPILWEITYVADTEPATYVVNIQIAHRSQTDALGNRTLVPIDFSGHISGSPTPKPN
jgi:hypothetical protein